MSLEFLDLLFEGTEGTIEIRPIREGGGGGIYSARRWYDTPAEVAAAIPSIADWGLSERVAIYFGVLPRIRGRGDRASVRGGRWVWVDLDFRDFDGEAGARAAVEGWPIAPGIVVASGHGLHLYWGLSEIAPPDRIEDLAKRLAAAIGGDHCGDSARVLRMPGTWNVKNPDRPVQVVIERAADQRLSIADLEKELPARAAAASAAVLSGPIPGRPSALIEGILERDTHVRSLYHGRNKNSGDTSGSGYDYSYTMALVARGVTDPADLAAALQARIRASRREKGGRYIWRTVSAALTQAENEGVSPPVGAPGFPGARADGSAGVSPAPGVVVATAPAGGGAPQRPAAPPGAEPDTWARLDLTRRGAAKVTNKNIEAVLSTDSRWVGRIWRNAFDGRNYCDQEIITDAWEVGVSIWIDEHYQIAVSSGRVHEIAAYCATKRTRHPVQEYLKGLKWDQEARVTTLFSRYFGAEDTPLIAEISRCFMVSLVARVMTPGAKCDTVPILIGRQGVGKSTGLRSLMPDPNWFSDTSIDFSRKDAYAQLIGVWLYELGELAGIRRRDVEPIKAFVSSRIDRYRPAYGRNVIEQPRQCVFAGSTNEQEILSDRTGSRRFWPIETGKVDVNQILSDRDQLWAEALVWWQTGSQWWLTAARADELEDMSGAFQAGDPWDLPVRRWIDQRRSPFTVGDILQGPLEKEVSRLNRADQMRLAGMLKGLGCTKVRRRVDGVRGWYWLPPGVD